jgi:hypothetical protein
MIKNISTLDQIKNRLEDLLKHGVALLPVGLFSTLTKSPWYHAFIYSLPVDLFSVSMGLQTLPMHYSAFKRLDFVYNFQNLIIFKREG